MTDETRTDEEINMKRKSCDTVKQCVWKVLDIPGMLEKDKRNN